MPIQSGVETISEETRIANQERLIQEVAIGLFDLMEHEGVTRADLARRLGRSRALISRMLSGSHNFTLTTLADVFLALNRAVHLSLSPDVGPMRLPEDEGRYDVVPMPLRLCHEIPGSNKAGIRHWVEPQLPSADTDSLWPLKESA